MSAVLEKLGYIVVDNVFPLEVIDSIRIKAIRNFENLQHIIKDMEQTLGIGVKEGFCEIVQRQRGRYEVTYGMSELCEELMERSEFGALNEILLEVFGEERRISNQSLVLSSPGTTDQTWHQDGPHVTITEHLPCHCLNM